MTDTVVPSNKARVLRVNKNTPIHIPAVAPREKIRPAAKPKYAMDLPPGAAALRDTAISRENYDGKELRPFDGRPGAMDAYSLPSKGFK